MDFNIRHRAGVIIFSPSGEIIGDASREFREVVAEQLASAPEAPKFLFDFATTPMMDSTGLGVLIGRRVQLLCLKVGRLPSSILARKLKRF